MQILPKLSWWSWIYQTSVNNLFFYSFNFLYSHVNKTTTYESPKLEIPITHPEPRMVEITRDLVHGFGFVVGSEKPVLIRCVNEGPSANQLLPGDEILEVNGQNVRKANQEHVIQLIK